MAPNVTELMACVILELRSLNAMCIGAGAAFDHLEAEQRRVENDSLRKLVEQLSGRASVTGIASA
jgi:hypothetical protein